MPEWIAPLSLLVALAVVERFWYVRYLQSRWQITFLDAPARSLLYFSAWSLAFIFLFPKESSTLFEGANIVGYFFMLFALFVAFPSIFRALRDQVGAPAWLTKEFPTQGLLTLEERYIVAKVGDVISQQLVAGIMIVMLVAAGVSYPAIVFSFVALFALSHLYLFQSSGFVWGMYYTVLAMGGAFAIPFFILFVPQGIFYSTLLHMLFYVMAGVFFAKLPRPTAAICRDIVGAEAPRENGR